MKIGTFGLWTSVVISRNNLLKKVNIIGKGVKIKLNPPIRHLERSAT
ncbi:hypothetical protein HDC90_003046 [Pedobacter sp. AK013]|nr:hypothetical protein [Pedobacter sp. AK013]